MTVEFMFDATDGVWTLDPNYPASSDPRKEGDDHMRGIKLSLTQTFPAIDVPITATSAEINYLDGVTGAIQTQLDAKLAASSYSAADVLSKLLTVDVDDSGINATTINSVALDDLAQLASADFTALQVGGADVATEAYADAAGPEVGSWVDVQNPLTSVNDAETVAHGLSARPDLLLFRLVCLSDDNGYSTDDVVELGTVTSSGGAPCWEGDATNITVRWRELRLTATDGSAAPTPGTSNDWKLQAKGIKF